MNSCWWIILLFACGGNCGNCGSSCLTRSRCGMNNQNCGCMQNNNDCGCDNGRNCNNDSDNRRSRNNDCDNNCDNNCDHNHDCEDDCDCNNDCGSNERSNQGCFTENSMTYETFGCQENGIPCPPPVPGRYTR